MSSAPIDLQEPVAEICKRLGLAENYVAGLNITPTEAKILLFKGRDGRCQGAKYVDTETGEAATEELTFRVSA